LESPFFTQGTGFTVSASATATATATATTATGQQRKRAPYKNAYPSGKQVPYNSQVQQQAENQKRDYIFTGHRIDNQMYAINKLLWNDAFNCLTTLGSDGTFAFWDIAHSKRLGVGQRLLSATHTPIPLTTGAFSADGRILAYASGNDYSKLALTDPSLMPTQILLHYIQDSDVRSETLVH
jgi:WD40 repeat protein